MKYAIFVKWMKGVLFEKLKISQEQWTVIDFTEKNLQLNGSLTFLSEIKCCLLPFIPVLNCLHNFEKKGKQFHFSSTTGCSVWKIAKVKGCSSETVHFWLYVGRAKMRLEGGIYFSIFKHSFVAVCLKNFQIN